MRKPTFCLYKCENEVADQIRGHVNAQLIGAYVFATEIIQVCWIRRQFFFSQRGSYSIIMISNHFKRACQLASRVWGLESLVGLRQFID